MKRKFWVTSFTIMFVGITTVIGQQLNGQAFVFKKGKQEWSDTVYKKLLTKEMAKKGKKPVLLAIRYKYERAEEQGNWYQIEITNKSNTEKVKFDVSSSHRQELFTVKLDPNETKIFKKLYYRSQSNAPEGEIDMDYLIPPYEEILQNRE